MAIDQPLQHPYLKKAVDRESQAFDIRVAAFLRVKGTYIKFGHSPETYRTMKSAEIADAAWRLAKEAADRIRGRLCTQGKAAALNGVARTAPRCTGFLALGRRKPQRYPSRLIESDPEHE